MRPRSTQLLLSAVVLLVAGILGLWVLRSRDAAHMQLVDKTREVEILLLERQLEPRGLPAIASSSAAGPGLRREPVDRATANQIFVLSGLTEYDPHTYYRHGAHIEQWFDLPEHPRGRYARRTNSAGEHEDHETFVTPPDVFVLVAGDSHTEGVCDNPESYPNLLEARLARSRPGKTVEVLNTGMQGYSFYNYLGVLEKYAERRPDVFVLGCYGGNDFLESLRPRHYFEHTLPPPQSRDYWDEMQKAKGISFDALAQAVNSILYFKRYPDEAATALETAEQVCAEIDRQCQEQGIPWIVVYIPSVFDGALLEKAELREHVRGSLALSDYDLKVIDRMADRFLARLRERGVEVLDMRAHFEPDGGPWYWPELHIDLAAHERIAEQLEPRVEAALAAKAAGASGSAGR